MLKKYISQEEKELRARINDLENKRLEISRQLSSYTNALREQKLREEADERRAVVGKCYFYNDIRWRVTSHKETNRTKTWILVLGEGDKDYSMHCLVVSESIIEEKDVSLFAFVYDNGTKPRSQDVSSAEAKRIIDSCKEIPREEFFERYSSVRQGFDELLGDG